ncbi:MAG: hypothetical protein JSR86_07865 [Proteobacteria bacterium]|nr:hypothetical protein [Pseudomonadota bacterium]
MKAPSVRLLLVLLTLSIIVPAVTLTGVLLWADYQRQETQFESQLLTNARAVSSAVDGRIGQGEGVLRVLAASGVDEGDLAGFYARAKAVTRDMPGWISLSDETGQQVLNTHAPFGAPLPGKMSAADMAQLNGQSMAVSNIFVGPVTQQLIFTVTEPVTLGGKHYLLSYVASPRTLDAVLESQHLPAGWAAGVTDRSGRLLSRWPDAEQYRGRPVAASFITAAKDTAEGVVRTHTVQGEPNVAAFSRSDVTGWTTAIGVPRSVLLQRAIRPLITLGVTASLLLAAGLAVTIVLGQRLSRAFALAVRRADDIGRGEHPRPAPAIVAEDEDLYRAMEQAAQRLDERNLENERAREHQRLLLNELNHRVKNTLSTVQSIALQTARQTGAPDAFMSAFEGRLLSLSKTHTALMNEEWEGASLRDVLESELLHYGEGRIELSGPTVMLPPRAALALGLVIHELATNASKYGALSSPTGRVAVAWRLDEEALPLRLEWTERGGPVVTAPSRRGFGSRLIERSLVSELAGQVDTTYEADGFRLVARVVLRPGGAKMAANPP